GDIPRRGAVDASFVPRILAWMMIGLGAMQLFAARRAVAGAADQATTGRAYAVVGISLALIAGFIALMRPLGFPVAASLFLFAQFWLLTPADRTPRPGLSAALAVTAAAVIFVTFRYGFNLLLPAGPLTPFLP
ncbi:MAG: tripartite tricarboxylate transporter TctB family protein, partial [Pseudorhodobacter sp.]